ncbi:hypothetical protein ACRWQN_15055 [Shewanella sp. HL-SH8]|uniref:hypothetical protein n=1 Tax=Shewanella sp. HL-SH8 TaxID=3436242 RepID=UPI003EB736DD
MQHKTKTNNDLDVTSIEKSVWSKPEIEVIDIGSTDGKAPSVSETAPFGSS